MTRSLRISSVLAFASGLGCAAPALAQDPAEVAVPFSRRIEVERGAEIRIMNYMGDVDVTVGAAGAVSVEGGAGSASTTRAQLVVLRRGDGVTICVAPLDAECDEDGIDRDGGHRRGERTNVDLRVSVPPGSEVHAGSGNGDVAVRGVRDAVSASSGNGDVRVEGAAAEVRASSGNGRVQVVTTGGPVNASTGNGRIEVVMGSVPANARMDFSSGNGDIILTLPAGFGGEVEASFGNGGLQSDFPVTIDGGFSRHRVRGTIGSGSARIHASSGNGDLVLRRR